MTTTVWIHRIAVTCGLAASQGAFLPVSAQGYLPPAPSTDGQLYALPDAAPAQPVRGAQTLRRIPSGGGLQLKLRRQADAVELIIENTGPTPQLQQQSSGSTWEGRLFTANLTALRLGPQRLSLPEAGFASFSIDGSGNQYRLTVTSMPGYPAVRPVVSADGRNLILAFGAPLQPALQTMTPNLTMPGRVAKPAFVPPLQPRAVAPPLGDMAVGTMMLSNPSYVNVSGPPVTMTLRNAPVRDVMMALSRLGGYGFVFVDDPGNGSASSGGGDLRGAGASRPISISFRNESYGRAINSALMAAGIQGKRDGNTIFAGPNVLGKSFGMQVSKVYRLNQASANAAADYLANLGASVTKTNTITTAVTEGVTQTSAIAGVPSAATTQSSSTTNVIAYGASQGPLKGLIGTTDTRLGTITLVGDPKVVAIAESYLRQLDLRQRQVALSVKLLDVTLDNAQTIDNSFAFRWGNNFIVNDNGQLLGAFGRNLPADANSFNNIETVTSSTSSTSSNSNTFTLSNVDNNNLSQSRINEINQELISRTGTELVRSTLTTGEIITQIIPVDSASSNTSIRNQSLIEDVLSRALNRTVNINRDNRQTSSTNTNFLGSRRPNPGNLYERNNFYNYVRAVIDSRSTKVLASPTLILSENSEELRKGDDLAAANIQNLQTGASSSSSSSSSGSASAAIGRTRANESYVTVGEQVITNYTVTTGTQGNGNSCEPEFGIAGLTFGARVAKIDDNGFVTFSLSPAITAKVREVQIAGCGPIDILAIRRLDTGSARVRDGQTLILTGVISESDNQEVSKWPILGDMPLIGQFFRSTSGNRGKRELVIMVTPRIIDDTEGGGFGYGYQPSTPQSRQFLQGY